MALKGVHFVQEDSPDETNYFSPLSRNVWRVSRRAYAFSRQRFGSLCTPHTAPQKVRALCTLTCTLAAISAGLSSCQS